MSSPWSELLSAARAWPRTNANAPVKGMSSGELLAHSRLYIESAPNTPP